MNPVGMILKEAHYVNQASRRSNDQRSGERGTYTCSQLIWILPSSGRQQTANRSLFWRVWWQVMQSSLTPWWGRSKGSQQTTICKDFVPIQHIKIAHPWFCILASPRINNNRAWAKTCLRIAASGTGDRLSSMRSRSASIPSTSALRFSQVARSCSSSSIRLVTDIVSSIEGMRMGRDCWEMIVVWGLGRAFFGCCFPTILLFHWKYGRCWWLWSHCSFGRNANRLGVVVVVGLKSGFKLSIMWRFVFVNAQRWLAPLNSSTKLSIRQEFLQNAAFLPLPN